MTFSLSSFGRPCILVVVLSFVHLVVALLYILYFPETVSFLPYLSRASFNLTSLPANWSQHSNNDNVVGNLEMESPSNTSAKAGAGQQPTHKAPDLCPETPPRLGKSFLKGTLNKMFETNY